MLFPAHPGDTVQVIVSPLELTPMLGPPPLLPTFISGRAFKPGGGTSCFPRLHGCEMWHTGQAPVLPGPRRRVGDSSGVSLIFFQAPLCRSERRHLCCWWKGKGSQNSQLFAMQSAVSPWLLLPSNPFKSRRGDKMGHWDGGGVPWKAASKA